MCAKKRGRPPVEGDRRKSTAMRVRLSKDEVERIAERARALGISVSEFVRRRALE